ncbi:MAG: hypothetical protein LBP75_00465 [Planctomycetota bacterium]|jgi:hypothetical protein|nr:hypothetical protein [Planctomycetota bacterium]
MPFTISGLMVNNPRPKTPIDFNNIPEGRLTSLRLSLNNHNNAIAEPETSNMPRQDSVEISDEAQKWSEAHGKPLSVTHPYQTYLDALADIEQSIATILKKKGIQVGDKEYLLLTVDDANKIAVDSKDALDASSYVKISASKMSAITQALNTDSGLGEKINQYKEICNKIPMSYRSQEVSVQGAVGIDDVDQKPEWVKQRQANILEFVRQHQEKQ